MADFEVIRTRSRIAKFAPEWNALWQRTGGNVFQHHAWISAWWDSKAGHASEPSVGICRRNGELIAVLPFAITRYSGVRVLEWAAQTCSDYCDGIGDSEVMPAILDAVITAGNFDLLRVKNVPADAACMTALRRVCAAEPADERCLGIRSQWRDGESWFATLNKKKRNNHRRGMRILAESGEVRFREQAAGEAWDRPLGQLITLKQQWLAATNNQSDLVAGDLLRSLVAALAVMGCLRIFLLECRQQLAAGLITAIHQNRLLAFFAAYDPCYERSSPGILLMTEVTKWAFDRGLEYVDYLRGEEAYKFEFANDATRIRHFTAGRTLVGRSANFAYSLLTARSRGGSPNSEIGAAYHTAGGTPRQIQ